MTDLKDKWMPLTRGEDGRPGHEFRIYADDHGEPFPIVGAVFLDGGWVGERWTSEGRTSTSRVSPRDLIPRPQTVWINVYPNGTAIWWPSQEIADRHANPSRLACIEAPKTWED